MILEVRQSFSHTHPLAKDKFIILYTLFLSHPHMLTYGEILDVLATVDLDIRKVTELKKLVKALKLELQLYGVNKLIISIKNNGYAISNKWVEPDKIKEPKDSKLLNYVRRMCGIAANMANNDR
jgi:DNA-binding response OmpR family regulator